jgi:hypothetical protein
MGLMYKFKVSLYDPVTNEVYEFVRIAESEEVIEKAYADTDAIILDIEELPAE